MPVEKKDISFNIMLSKSDKAKLDQLKEKTGWSGGFIIRAAFLAHWSHSVRGVFSCATGQPCLAPQFHQPQASVPPAAEPLTEAP